MKDYTLIPNEYLSEMTLSVNAKYLLCVLLKRCGVKAYCWPTQKTLSKTMNCTTRTVRKYLTELEQNGFLTKTREGFNRPNIYFIKNRLNESYSESDWTESPIKEDAPRVTEARIMTESHDRKDASPHSGKGIPNDNGKDIPPNITSLILPINTTSQDSNEGIEILRNKLKELNLKR